MPPPQAGNGYLLRATVDGVDLLVDGRPFGCSRGYTLRAAAAVDGAADTSWLEGPLQLPDDERAPVALGHMLNHAPSELGANCAVEPPVLLEEGESADLLARVPTVCAAPVGAPPPPAGRRWVFAMRAQRDVAAGDELLWSYGTPPEAVGFDRLPPPQPVGRDGPGEATRGRLAALLAHAGVDLPYVKNRLVYTSLTQPLLLSEEFPSATQRVVYPRDQCLDWPAEAEAAAAAAPVEHPDQPGLWLLRGALSTDECAAVSEAVAELSLGHSVQGRDPGVAVIPPCDADAVRSGAPDAEATWPWFEYWPARYMLPLQPGGGVDPDFAAHELAALHSHNCTDARTWPALSAIAGAGGDALRALERIPPERIAPFAGRPPLFVQLQALERGAVIAAHVDEPGVGGRAIATTVIAGASEVRVGAVAFVVRAGDMYCLTNAARDDIDHEVYSGTEDRLSVTMRFG